MIALFRCYVPVLKSTLNVFEPSLSSIICWNIIFDQVQTQFCFIASIKTKGEIKLNYYLSCSRVKSFPNNQIGFISFIWDKALKNGPSKICGRQPLKTWSDMVCLRRPYYPVPNNSPPPRLLIFGFFVGLPLSYLDPSPSSPVITFSGFLLQVCQRLLKQIVFLRNCKQFSLNSFNQLSVLIPS